MILSHHIPHSLTLVGLIQTLLQLSVDKSWYHFDDAHVSAVNESEIKSSAAYVLFYQRVKKPSANGKVGEQSFCDRRAF